MTSMIVSQKIKMDYTLRKASISYKKSRPLFIQHSNLLALHLGPSLFLLIFSLHGLAILLLQLLRLQSKKLLKCQKEHKIVARLKQSRRFTANLITRMASSWSSTNNHRRQNPETSTYILKKEHIISELKEKVVVLNSGIRQLEMQVEDLGHQNMQVKIFLVLYCANLMTPKYGIPF